MAYNELLADRIKHVLHEKHVVFEEKKIMGGLCFTVDRKMCVGITGNNLMARINPDVYDECLKKEGCSEMNFTGRPMRGFVFVAPEANDLDEDLQYWIQLCLDFNPLAKSSRKK